MFFFRGKERNFGDELNNWLLPKIFPNFFDTDDAVLFLGIGSILYDSFPTSSVKIVFGSGYGGYTPAPIIDESWRIYCVRGPKTASACRIPSDLVVGDAATLVARYKPTPRAEKIKIAFMPHVDSIERGNWRRVCKLAGMHMIDPRAPVKQILEEIASTELLLSEAMHGVIVADSFRVPWIAIEPIDRAHKVKWQDWSLSVGIDINACNSHPSSVAEFWLKTFRYEHWRARRPNSWLRPIVALADAAFARGAAIYLKRCSQLPTTLSADSALEAVLLGLENCASKIRRDFGISAHTQ